MSIFLIFIFTIQTPGESLHQQYFAQVSDLIVTESGVYVSDLRSAQIFKFDHDGNQISRTGRQGRGPGEFQMGPNRMVKADGRLLVLDQLPGSLNIFNPDLSLQEVIVDRDVFIPAYDAFHHADSLLFMASSPIYGENFGKYNLRGGLISEIEIPDLHGMGLRDTFTGFSTGKQLALIWTYINRLDRFTPEGVYSGTCQISSLPDEVDYEIQHFDIPTNNMTEEQATLFNKGVYLPSGQLIRGVAQAGEHLIVQYGGRFNNGIAIVIDTHCEIIHEFEFPGSQRIMFYDEQRSRLYFTYEL
ncbi:MAG: 6-bladed beta-propeller, partial [Balneolia bacterium]|nr:6-bladed beta-propeller [Balneolia bacterium]